MKSFKNFKNIFIFVFCAVSMICFCFLTTNINSTQINKVFASTNTAVSYKDNNSLGSFIDGYVYQFTDSTKYEGYRATPQTQTTDTTTIVINSSAELEEFSIPSTFR